MTTVSPSSFNASSDPEKEDCPYVYGDIWVWRKSYLTQDTYRNLVAITCINFLLVVPNILLNALVIFVVATRRRLQSNTNILLACLARTDLQTELVVQPISIAVEIKRIHDVGPFCSLGKAFVLTFSVLSFASTSHLVLISVDRYIAIKRPLRYLSIVTKQRLSFDWRTYGLGNYSDFYNSRNCSCRDRQQHTLHEPITLEVKRISGVGPFCTLEKLNAVVFFVVCFISFGHLVLISIERYIAIKYSLRCQEIVTKRRLMTGVFLAWAMIMLLQVIHEITLAKSMLAFKRVKNAINTIIILVCIAVIIYINCYIFSETRRQKIRIQTEQISQEEAKRIKKDKKTANTLAIILAALTLTYLPFMVMAVIRTTAPNLIKPSVTSLLWNWITTFIMLGSLLNPVIYCWRMKKLRRAFLEIFHFRSADIQGPST
ncbi:adenosine receptor A1-like [Oculina patagonica]